MKKFIQIFGLLITIFVGFSCSKKDAEVTFKDQVKYTIYDYIVANKENYSSFLSIIEKGGIAKILSAYNPYAEGYTLFLPDNKAIDTFIQQSGKYTSLNDLLNDIEYVTAICKYHVIKKAFKTDDFPFGAFPINTLSGDLLTVSFISGTDSAYYKINNQAPVILQNIKVSNGFIHIISNTLKPIIYTTYNWLEQNQGYSIFKAAVDLTGLKSIFDINFKDGISPFTLLVEHDSIFNKRKIYTLQDLQNFVSPNNTDYSNPLNPLYNFVTYHLLTGNNFLNNFDKRNTNYTTYSDIPLRINGNDYQYAAINDKREVFDTIVNGTDSTFINYISFNYDASNVLTQSGVIHFIDQVMTQKSPIMAAQYYEFWEEPLFNEFRQIPGTYLVEDSAALYVLKYSGTDMFYTCGETSRNASNYDYISLNGDFTFSYTIPKVVQGTYYVKLRTESTNTENAIVQVYIDGKNIGGLINLTTGGTSTQSFYTRSIGTFNFIKYEKHTIVIKSLIPGQLLLDQLIFDTNK